MGMRYGGSDVGFPTVSNWVTHFGASPHCWNLHEDADDADGDGSGLPGKTLVGDALRTFGDCWGEFDPISTAAAFNLPLWMIEAALPSGPFETDPEDVTLSDLGAMIAVLTGCRSQLPTSVHDVVRLTNQHALRVVEAIGGQFWLSLSGDRDDLTKLMIEADGE